MAKNIAVVVPSHKQELTDLFLKNWQGLFDKHNVEFILVDDSGESPKVEHKNGEIYVTGFVEENNLISNHCAGVRQLGFQYIAQNLPDVEYILTFDTDTAPIGDPIQDHINALNMKVPLSWFATASDYMRGFPYGVRNEAQVVVSHGVWEGNYDWDAPSQLLKSDKKVDFYKGVVPRGVFTPLCGMNFAFRREVLKYVYFAPVGQYKGAERFDDIWMGIELTKSLANDTKNLAIVSGYAKVNHLRASNVFASLEKEAVGIAKNEEYWKGEYDDWYKDFIIKRKKWYDYVVGTQENI
jgi:reversibly glycosylated polypeptide/UDP-arabinopyranose mutase